MSIGSMIRWLLAWAAALVVVWSFFEVGMRLWREHDPSDHRTRLVIMQWGDASEEQIVEGLKNQYEKEHPDIKIERIHANDFDPKLKTMMAAGTPPDLFYLNSDWIRSLPICPMGRNGSMGITRCCSMRFDSTATRREAGICTAFRRISRRC